MKKILSALKNKYVIAVVVVLAAAGIAFFRTGNVAHSENCPGAAPTSPVFNYWPLTYDTSATCHDLALIDARNVTANGGFSQSQAQHDAGVSANVGDTVEVSVYFHNGASDQISRSLTTAHNVRFATNFDISAQTDHTVSGTLSADNAATVTSTSAHQGGNIIIHTGATPTVLKYVPGSTYMCVTQQAASELGRNDGTCGLTTSGVRINMPDGIANGSVAYPGGDLKACFPYSGTINYSVTIGSVAPPKPTKTTISITKTVADVTSGTSASTSTSAKSGDTVQYTITVKDTGSINATNVAVTDPGASGITGSLGTKNVGTLTPGQSQTYTYNGTVTASSGSLVNTATATADNANQVQASATVNVTATPPPVNGQLTVTKQVKDLTQGSSGWSNSVNANWGDRLAYQIVITAQNGNLQNVTSNEQLPQYFQLSSGSVRLNNQQVSDNYATGSQNLGSLNSGNTDTIYFEGTISGGSGSCSSTTLTNTVTVSADNTSSQSASASVYIQGQSCCGNCCTNCYQQNAQLNIVKQVKNDTYGNYYQKNVNAYPNDRVTFQIAITDVGNTTANNVVLNDQLPNGLSYAQGSMYVSGGSGYYNNNNYGYNGYINIGSLGPGQTSTITFDATVVGNAGQTIQNIAQASASNAGTVQDYATVFVNNQSIGTTNLQLSKTAFNQTQNINATTAPAHANDYIQYTLTVNNTGTAPANNYVVQDDLSNVITYASVVSLNGGTMNGNVISWPSTTIPAGGTVTETFIARINNANALPNATNLQIVNTFGNTVTVQIAPGQVLGITYTAPSTGVGSDLAFGFALAITAGFALLKNKVLAGKLVANLPKIKIK